MANTKATLQDWLSEGPYTLSLCSHFFGFYSHTAMTEQLYLSNTTPNKITGTSAGALVGGALASGMTPTEFKKILFSKTAQDYWDPKIGFGLLAGKKFLSVMQSLFVPDFSQTHIPLSVGVAELPRFKMKFLSSGNLPQSVLASCAVPIMFPPVKIGSQWYYDGGLLQKSGIDPVDQNKRVLNVYLDTQQTLMKKKLYKNKKIWGDDHRIVYLPQTPLVNPRNLLTGQEGYRKTMERIDGFLTKRFQENILVL